MNIVAFVLGIGAGAVFAVSAYLTRNLVALGLALLTVALIVQFAATSHTVTF